ncbi:MAG: beta-lactamase family protein [Gemmatimonadota bacterium]|nr:MAG: beta-lactamase family protein [Gemmatimonadota bacterium]
MSLIMALLLLLQTGAKAAIDDAVADGIRAGAFPGAVVVIGTRDTVLLAKGYGHFTYSADSRVPSPDSTVYDLASLTKVVATTPSVMRLVEAGALDLEAPVQTYLPDFVGEGKQDVTVRHLLEHLSGLRSFLPLNDRAATAEEARHLVVTEELRWAPGTRMEYSDLNAMLLGWVIEGVTGVPLDEYSAREVFGPLGMTQTRFRPPRSWRPRIAPVGLWRGYVIAGELHDQNAVRLGGVSGHAGLYSTGLDLARYAQMYLNQGRDSLGEQRFRSETIEMFTERGYHHRSLGWEMNDTTEEGHTGTLLSDRAFGHGGYTGTSIWIDPSRDLFVIVLTNRVYSPRTGRSISTLRAIRGRIADAAVALRAEQCSSVVIGAKTRRRC